MPAHADKIIVTNISELKAKYASGFSKVKKAVAALIAADKKRGIKTVISDLSSPAHMKRYGGRVVRRANDPKANKNAIDAIFKAADPPYLMILGAPDVVAHQDLKNPAYSSGGDPDEFAYGDLPYACADPYSQDPADFIGPTRVVGRLPDLSNQGDADYLAELLDTAARYTPRPASGYLTPLGISAQVWKGSTALSLQAAFGSTRPPLTSPKSGPNWTAAQFGRLAHFINCHGAPADPKYYGQRGSSYPDAHDAAVVATRAVEGTVVAAECCYGAELYDPSLGGQAGICNTYLGRRGYGFFGSSTIAYGPANANASADLICQYFFKYLLMGASLGRAVLEARQEFVRVNGTLGPIDLKTLAQFSLMADPSLAPITAPSAEHVVSKGAGPKALSAALSEPSPERLRATRRSNLVRQGEAIGALATAVSIDTRTETPSAIQKVLGKVVSSAGAASASFFSFEVERPGARSMIKGVKALSASISSVPARRMHVAVAKLPDEAEGRVPPKLLRLLAVVAHEQDGNLVIRQLFSR